MQTVDVIIIGAGSAGLSALRQVKESTDNFLLIDQLPLGTTCARTGCMPSKALILAANDYHRRRFFPPQGIAGGDGLSVHVPDVLRHVRRMRDGFATRMAETTKRLAGERLVTGKAQIVAPDCVRVNGTDLRSRCLIIATGSRPVVPSAWRGFGERLLTSETLFEQTDLPGRIGVIGLGAIGLETGQALSRLGIAVTGFDARASIGGLTDPAVNERAVQLIGGEFPIFSNAAAKIEAQADGLVIHHPDRAVTVDAALVAVGVRPQVSGLGLENLGVDLDDKGLPAVDPHTLQVGDLPVYIAGDANGARPILHEALDEGFIAGRNGAAGTADSFCRRTPLALIFSDPQIARAGQTYRQLQQGNQAFVVGTADFQEQSRAVLEQRNAGVLNLYADRDSGKILGGEMACPDAEHLGQLLAAAVERGLTVFEMLGVPFYHPTIEEALRTALQDAAGHLSERRPPDRLSVCASTPEAPLR